MTSLLTKAKQLFRQEESSYHGVPVTSREFGFKGESLALEFLKGQCFEILEQNYSVRSGEIDIIAKFGETVVFIEVKSLSSDSRYFPEEQVTRAKRRRIEKAAQSWLQKKGSGFEYFRFDVVALCYTGGNLKIEHFVDAWTEGD